MVFARGSGHWMWPEEGREEGGKATRGRRQVQNGLKGCDVTLPSRATLTFTPVAWEGRVRAHRKSATWTPGSDLPLVFCRCVACQMEPTVLSVKSG